MGKKPKKKSSVISAQEFDRQIDENLNKPRAIEYIKYDKIKNKGKISNIHMDENDMKDEIDVFMEGKDKIDLNDNNNNDNNDDYNEDSDEYNQHNTSLDLPDYDEEDEENNNKNKTSKHKYKADLADENEDDYYVAPHDYSDIVNNESAAELREKQLKREANISKAWGKKKTLYYSADTVDYEIESDEEVALNEEKEAIRLQNERAAQLNEADYNISDMINDIVKEETTKNKQNNVNNKKSKKAIQSDSEILASMNKELNSIDIDNINSIATNIITNDNDTVIERINKDTEHLTRDEKLQIILTESPELFGLLDELKDKLNIINNVLKPKLIQLKQLNVNNDYVFMKYYMDYYQLLLMYTTNIIFYLSLTAEKKTNIKQHPIIHQILGFRQLLERNQYLKNKFEQEMNEFIENPQLYQDKYKIQPKQQNSKQNGKVEKKEIIKDNEDYYSDEQDEDEFNYNGDMPNPDDFDADDFDNFSDNSINNTLNNTKKRKSEPEPDLFSDINALNTNNTDKTNKKKQKSVGFSIDTDFGDINSEDEANIGLVKKPVGEKLLKIQQQLKEANERLAKQQGNNKKKSNNNIHDSDNDSLNDDDLFGDLDASAALAFYNSTNQKTKAKKLAHKQEYSHEPQRVHPSYNPNNLTADKRAISSNIKRNRGLTRNRRKDIKTPKTHNRMRYEKKIKQRHSQVQEYKGSKALGYSGEATGIKTHLTKSVSLRS